MDNNIILENHIEGITYQCRETLRRLDEAVNRIEYIESILSTLLVALIKEGVIVPEKDGDNQF
jgi:hypothetical protein|tara:strand:- start:625 stop:813 length:189 start_codon:yes stop_codon:yes gene_type:complete